MNVKKIILSSILFIILAANAYAAFELKAEVDKKALSTDDELVYKLSVSSSDEKALPVPRFPDFKDFYLASQANTSNIAIKGRESHLNVIYIFVLLPKQPGKLKIAPAQIQLKGQVIKSAAFEIDVSQGKKKSIPPTPSLPQEGAKEEVVL